MSAGRWLLLGCIAVTLAVLIGVLALARPDWFQGWIPARGWGGPAAAENGEPPHHGFMGVSFAQDQRGSLVIRGALKNSPAADAGVQKGDTIVAIGGIKRPDIETLQGYMKSTRPGQEIEITLQRRDQTMNLHLKLLSFEEMMLLEQAQRMNED